MNHAAKLCASKTVLFTGEKYTEIPVSCAEGRLEANHHFRQRRGLHIVQVRRESLFLGRAV